jgi:hypothetical protein
VSLPGLAVHSPIEHQHLLRAMDALVAQQVGVDKVIAGLLRPLKKPVLHISNLFKFPDPLLL